VIELGPPNASIHKIDEHVVVADIEPLKNIYRRTLENLNRQASTTPAATWRPPHEPQNDRQLRPARPARRHRGRARAAGVCSKLLAFPLATAPPTPTTKPPGWCCGDWVAAGQ
jgi:hypothetical protein